MAYGLWGAHCRGGMYSQCVHLVSDVLLAWEYGMNAPSDLIDDSVSLRFFCASLFTGPGSAP